MAFRCTLLVGALAFGLAVPSSGSALTVTSAKVANGAVQVKGAKAAPLALIFWEATPVAQATRSGSFRFQTTILPGDCVGELGDGADTVPVVIQFCGPPGPEGPPGERGERGEPGEQGPPGISAPLVKDANGMTLGILTGLGDYNLLHRVGSTIVGLTFNPSNPSILNGNAGGLAYPNPGCTGTPQLHGQADWRFEGVIAQAFVDGTTLHYQTGPGIMQPYQSLAHSGACYPFPSTGYLAPVATEDLGAFVLPFHVEVQ